MRDNIARFGGDPSRITIFGQSAGGMSVDYYAYTWTKDPIISGIIAESGSAGNLGGTGGNLSAGWYRMSQKLGCGGVDAGAQTLTCVRTKPWQSVLGAIEKRGVTPNMGDGGFGPTVDGKVVFGDYPKRRAEGNFIKVVRLCCDCSLHMVRTTLTIHKISLSLWATRTTKAASTNCSRHHAAGARCPRGARPSLGKQAPEASTG